MRNNEVTGRDVTPFEALKDIGHWGRRN